MSSPTFQRKVLLPFSLSKICWDTCKKFSVYSTMKMEVMCSSESSANFCWTVRRQVWAVPYFRSDTFQHSWFCARSGFVRYVVNSWHWRGNSPSKSVFPAYSYSINYSIFINRRYVDSIMPAPVSSQLKQYTASHARSHRCENLKFTSVILITA
jgi:hypothetical protein